MSEQRVSLADDHPGQGLGWVTVLRVLAFVLFVADVVTAIAVMAVGHVGEGLGLLLGAPFVVIVPLVLAKLLEVRIDNRILLHAVARSQGLLDEIRPRPKIGSVPWDPTWGPPPDEVGTR